MHERASERARVCAHGGRMHALTPRTLLTYLSLTLSDTTKNMALEGFGVWLSIENAFYREHIL